jgi:hypothetical protein
MLLIEEGEIIMKKKIIAMSLALVVVAGVGKGIVAKAETYTQGGSGTQGWSVDDTTSNGGASISDGNGVTSQKNVTVTSTAASIVYSVDINWGAMTINDNAATWNPSTHSYEGGSATWDNGGGSITVTNHSNTKVYSTCGFAQNDISGTYPQSNLNVSVATESNELASAVGVSSTNTNNEWTTAGIEKTHSLTVTGALNSTTVATNLQLGTVTITLKNTN